MAEETQLFGRKLRFGLWCVRKIVEHFGLDNTQQIANKLAEDYQYNMPQALMIANNSRTNSENIELEQAMDLIDEYGGIDGDEINEFKYQLMESMGISRKALKEAEKSEEPKSKQQPSKKK